MAFNVRTSTLTRPDVAGTGARRGVETLTGRGYFEDSHTLRVETSEGQKFIRFGKAILAVGSKPAMPKAFDLGNPRVMTSTEALELEEVPKDLLIVGGGYIGMELGTVYAALGSRIVVVEALPAILAGADADLARYVMKYAETHFKQVRVSTKVTKMATSGKQIKVEMDLGGKKVEELYDRVLVSVGRTPNCADLGLQNTKVARDDKGFVKVDAHQRTSDPNILAIGDVAGGLLLAHKAAKEARIAVEGLAGEASTSEGVVIPAVVFTEPEVAWCGLTETEAREKGIEVKVSRFPWGASGKRDRSESLPFSVRRIRPRDLDGQIRRHHEAHRRARDRAPARRRHRRPRRRRADRRSGARDRDGRDGARSRRGRPSAPDAVGNADGSRRSVLRRFGASSLAKKIHLTDAVPKGSLSAGFPI